MELSPAPDAFAIEFRGLDEDVQRAVDRLAEVLGSDEGQRTRLEQRAAVVGGVSRVALGVDREPRLAVRPQDVPGVEVAVDQDVRLGAPQLADGRHRRVHHVPRHGVRQLLLVPA